MPPESRAEAVKLVRECREEADRAGEEAGKCQQGTALLHNFVANELDRTLRLASLALEADFGNVNWSALKERDPMSFLRRQGALERRMANLAALSEQRGLLDQAGQAAYAGEQDRQSEREVAVTREKVRNITGGHFSHSGWCRSARDYLAGLGAPAEHLNGLTHGYQLEVLAKAMKYDELSRNADSARAKLAAAPKVMSPKGAGGGDAGWAAAKAAALNHMRKNPDSTDAIAAYLNYL